MVIASPAIDPPVSRPRLPDESGFIDRDGVRVAWDRYGPAGVAPGDPPTILLMPSWSIVHTRLWKAQVAYLARSHRVLAFDGRGNGRSDRPGSIAAYAVEEFSADALAVMDATSTPRAVLVSLSMGGQWSLLLAATHPERVAGAVFIGPALPLAPPDPSVREGASFDDELEVYEGWDKYNRHYWRRDYRGLPGILLRRVPPRAAFDQADRGLRGLGPRHRCRDAAADRGRTDARRPRRG